MAFSADSLGERMANLSEVYKMKRGLLYDASDRNLVELRDNERILLRQLNDSRMEKKCNVKFLPILDITSFSPAVRQLPRSTVV